MYNIVYYGTVRGALNSMFTMATLYELKKNGVQKTVSMVTYNKIIIQTTTLCSCSFYKGLAKCSVVAPLKSYFVYAYSHMKHMG